MDVKILGSGCRNCQKLEANTRQALADLGIEAEVDHVRDEVDILSWGVMSTPALVIGDQVVVSGRVPSADHVRDLVASGAADSD